MVFGFSLFGCESDEIRALNKAQACMDEVPADNPSVAGQCFAYVEKYSSQQANILKCSIKLTEGGLGTDKIVDAYKVSKDDSLSGSQKQVAYLGALTLSSYALAQEAYGYCVLSEISGLKFIGGLAQISSMLGTAYDPGNPSGSIAAIESALNGCVTGSSCDMAATGAIVADLSDTYCANPTSDQEVCSDINQAIDAAGGDAELAARQFMCQLQNKTYVAGSCQ